MPLALGHRLLFSHLLSSPGMAFSTSTFSQKDHHLPTQHSHHPFKHSHLQNPELGTPALLIPPLPSSLSVP